MTRRIIGVDIGGTNLSAALVTEKGEVIKPPVTQAIQSRKKAEIVVENICRTIEKVARREGIKKTEIGGIGLGIPTTLDQHGLLVESNNLPTLGGKDLNRLVGDHFPGIKIKTENDANCFILGEAKFGTAKGYDYCCGVTLGTGLGVGLFLGGKLYRGRTGAAGEVFQSPYKNDKNLEYILSGPGITKAYYRKSGKYLEPKEVASKANTGELKAIEVWHTFGQALGFALSYIVNLLDINVIVIGGSISKAEDLFIDNTRQVLSKFTQNYEELRIFRTKLDKLSGIAGAAALILYD